MQTFKDKLSNNFEFENKMKLVKNLKINKALCV